MARVLIVGCGCRGLALAGELRAGGHAVRGTTRDEARGATLRRAGVEPWVGDPGRLATLTRALESVTVVCWLLASAADAPERLRALHDERLGAYLRQMVDTTVRGFAYEAAGTAGQKVLERGREVAEAASRTWELPLAFIEADPVDHATWATSAATTIGRLLDERSPASEQPGVPG